jgi:hypothetical protein
MHAAFQRPRSKARSYILGALVIALCAAPALAAQQVPYLPVPRGAAVILDTGSTNALGYRIVVQRNGDVEYVTGSERKKTRIGEQKADAFFSDLTAAMPLSKLRSGNCMKSASFGTSTFAWWHGQRSSDLQCAADPQATALYSSVSAIAIKLGLGRILRPLPTNEPRRPMPEPS